MLRLPSVSVPLDLPEGDYPRLAARLLGVSVATVVSCRLSRRSVDARRRDDVHLVVTLDVDVGTDEAGILARCKHPGAGLAPVHVPAVVTRVKPPARRPVVVGSGPAGLFAALSLARAGAEPVLLERGRDVAARQADVAAFFAGGSFQPESNVQFGEGGAGTFSDGKLNTGIKDPRCQEVLRAFVRAGAPEEILWQAKPHIGTDHLARVVAGLRAEIESHGGVVRFSARVDGVIVDDGAVRGVRLADGETIETGAVVLAVGHSARDTLTMLHAAGIAMIAKPFSIGARIEHAQAAVDRAQYGRFAGYPALGAADYKLSAHLPNGRGVYTFCMCPGGVVVAAASETGGVVTNGMSRFLRDGANANSGLLVDVRPEDFGGENPLAGIEFQRKWERLAFAAGGGDYRAPAQLVGDFLAGRASTRLGDVQPTYRPGVVPSDLRACLPEFAWQSMAEGIRRFGRQLAGFDAPGAVLTGVETRSSCPVRIPRGETGEANIRGLFPAGEGAGYAGGILSAAVDGLRAGEHVLSQLEAST